MSITQADTSREALRQRSVQDILQAFDLQSQIANHRAVGRLNAARADQLSRLAEFDVPKARAEIDLINAQTGNARANTTSTNERTKDFVDLRSLNKQQLQTEIASRRASGELAQAQADRLIRLAGTDLQQAQAELQRLSDDTAFNKSTEPLRRKKLENEAATVNLTDPETGQTYTIERSKLPTLLESRERLNEATANNAAVRRDAATRLANATQDNAQKRLDNATVAESNLIKPPKGQTPESLAPYTEVFNANSDEPAVYISYIEPGGVLSSDKTVNKKFALPRTRGGEQLTARQVYTLAKETKLSTRDYLERFVYAPLGVKPPWQP